MSIGNRIKYARKMRHLTMEKLSGLTHGVVSKYNICRYERDRAIPRLRSLQAMASALDIPVSYFSNTDLECTKLKFRDIINSESLDMNYLEQKAVSYVEQYLCLKSSLRETITFVNPISSTIITSDEDAEHAAESLREAWKIGDSSITSVFKQLERHGIIVLEDDLRDVDGFSTWANDKYPIMMLNDNVSMPVERRRFSACHELGHLLMNIPEKIEAKQVEHLCNVFAGAFLFPRAVFVEELGRQRSSLDLQELIELKNEYGVSIASLVHRAKDLGIISYDYYNYFYDNVIHLNRMETGWGRYPFVERAKKMERMERQCNDRWSGGETKNLSEERL